MLPTRGLLYLHGENAWYHISSRGLTTKLRRVDLEAPPLTFRLPADDQRLRQLRDRSDVYTLGEIAVAVSPYLEFPARGFPHEERERWLEVAELLMDARPAGGAAEVAPNPLPISRLRRFYETLRLFPTRTVHAPIADYLTKDPDSAEILDALFADSLAHLNSYRNLEDDFRPAGARNWWPQYVRRRDAFARCLVARLNPAERPGSFLVTGEPPLQFRVVDYEISPLRTRGGRKFEDGTAARKSGGGGVDLLCATQDGLPVIGEIKAPTDTSLFVALVQALTYASELLTLQQMARLSKAYPDAFWTTGRAPSAELVLFVQAWKKQPLEAETIRLAKALVGNPEGAVAKHIRRISVVDVDLGEGRDVDLSLRDSIPSAFRSAAAATP